MSLKEINIYTYYKNIDEKNILWISILNYNNTNKIINDKISCSDIDRVQLHSIISSIGSLKEQCKINLYLFSKNIFNIVSSGKILDLISNNWKDNNNNYVTNHDIWKILYIQNRVKKHKIKFKMYTDKDKKVIIKLNEAINSINTN